jgi:hypothetical protein
MIPPLLHIMSGSHSRLYLTAGLSRRTPGLDEVAIGEPDASTDDLAGTYYISGASNQRIAVAKHEA